MMNKIDAVIAAGIGEVTAWYFIYLLGQPGAIEKLGVFGGHPMVACGYFPDLGSLRIMGSVAYR